MIKKLVDNFLIFKAENNGSSNNTVKSYQHTLTVFEKWLSGRDPLAVSEDELLVFTGIFLHKTYKLTAVSRTPYISCIREFYRYLHEVARLMKENPANVVSYPKKSMKLPRVMSLANAEKLMWAPDYNTFKGVRDSAMLSLLIGCGFRVSGLSGLNQSDIITHDINGEPRLAVRVTEKGEKERIVPIPREADLLLRIYLEHPELQLINRFNDAGDQVLFVTIKNSKTPAHEYYGESRRFSAAGIWKMIKKYGKEAGISEDQLHPHAMRHLYGTELAESDVDILVRQKLMGHSDPKTTEIYTNLASRKLTQQVDKANPLGKLKTPVTAILRDLNKGKKEMT